VEVTGFVHRWTENSWGFAIFF